VVDVRAAHASIRRRRKRGNDIADGAVLLLLVIIVNFNKFAVKSTCDGT